MGRKCRFVTIEEPDYPQGPVGITDAMELIGTTLKTIKKGLDRGVLYGVHLREAGTYEVEMGRKCVRCGGEIMNVTQTVYCDNCREANREAGRDRKSARGYAVFAPQKKRIHKRHEVPYEEKSDLARVAYDAQQAGLSYGGYLTRKTARWFG